MKSVRTMISTAGVAVLAFAMAFSVSADAVRTTGLPVAPPAAAAKPNSTGACAMVCNTLPLLNKNVLSIGGSTTVRPITERVQSPFELASKSSLTVSAAGSSVGIRALIEGNCKRLGVPVATCDLNADSKLDDPIDMAASSGVVIAAEMATAAATGCCLNPLVVAIDGLGIIVNTGNSVPSLTRKDIAQIYTNMAVSDPGLNPAGWGTYGGPLNLPIVPISRTTEGGTFGSFVDLYITPEGKTAADIAANTHIVYGDSNDQLVLKVQNTPGGIAYVGIAFVNESGIRSVPVRKTAADPAVAASFQTVQDGTFQFRRTLQYYTCGVPSPDDLRSQYLDFVDSRLGQSLTYEVNYVPAYPLNPIADVDRHQVEPILADLLKAELPRIEDKLAIIADPAQPQNVRDESRFALAEWATADKTLVGNVVARAVACGKNPKEIAKASASYADALALLAGGDYVGANLAFQDALNHAQQALK